MTDDVIAKVRKILQLAGDSGATEGEREAAAEAATRLMIRHRITQDDLDAAGEGPHRVDVVAEDVGLFGPTTYWALDLLTAIGQVVTVDAVFIEDGAGDRATTLVGRPDAVAWVRLLYGWIRPQVEHDARVIVHAEESYRRFMGRPPTPDDLDRYRDGFYAGATQRLHERLVDVVADEAGGRGTDLVVSDRAALARYYGDDAPRQVDTAREIDAEAVVSGYRAADRVDLRPGARLDGDAPQLPAG